MNKSQARKIDKDFYVDYEENMWCVFGDNSGFCYATPPSKEDAEIYIEKYLRPFLKESFMEDKITTTKPYIIENIEFPKGTVFRIEEKNNFDNLLIKKDGTVLTGDEFDKLADPLLGKIQSEGLVPDNNQVTIMNDLKKYCSVYYARNFKMPEQEEVINYMKNRTQTFATN